MTDLNDFVSLAVGLLTRTLALRLRGGSRKQTLSSRDPRRPRSSVVNDGGRAAVGYTANIEDYMGEGVGR